MRVKNMMKDFNELEFYAIRWSFNDEKPVYTNIMTYFDGEAFNDALFKYKSITNYEELYKWVSMELKYQFFSKSEHEMMVNSIHSTKVNDAVKIDVYSQLLPNIEKIVDIINVGFELGFEKPINLNKKEHAIISYE